MKVPVWGNKRIHAAGPVVVKKKTADFVRNQRFYGCGDRTRTCDLRVMSPTSYQLLYSAISTKMVPVTGLEPVQHHCREILSLLCLPFHHTGSFSAMNRIPQRARFCQGFVKKTFRRLSSPFAGAGKKEPLSEHRRAAQAGGILESFRDYDTPAGPACK